MSGHLVAGMVEAAYVYLDPIWRVQRESPGLRAWKREAAPAAASSARRNPACAPRPAGSMLTDTHKIKKPPDKPGGFLILVETAGIEPASRSTLQTVLHT